jgi:undecaprenyl-diphosphatase
VTILEAVLLSVIQGVFEAVFARPVFIAGTLTVTGILLWWTDVLPRRRRGLRQIGPGTAAVVGLGQALALFILVGHGQGWLAGTPLVE